MSSSKSLTHFSYSDNHYWRDLKKRILISLFTNNYFIVRTSNKKIARLDTNAISYISSCRFTGPNNLHHLVLTQTVIAGHGIKDLDARQLWRVQTVSLQQLHFLLVREHLAIHVANLSCHQDMKLTDSYTTCSGTSLCSVISTKSSASLKYSTLYPRTDISLTADLANGVMPPFVTIIARITFSSFIRWQYVLIGFTPTCSYRYIDKVLWND